jgi:hypothetical protein
MDLDVLDVCAVSASAISARRNSSGFIVKFSWFCLRVELLLWSWMAEALFLS